MKFMMEQFLKATGAKVLKEGAKMPCVGISTDSRTLKAGELFFALHGPNFDGHDYCKEALQKGGWGIIVEKALSTEYRVPSTYWIFQVSDTLRALGDVAQWWRSQFSTPCVAITGSNGKTTTKEMTAAILNEQGPVLKTEGNFNNLIGLPLTLNRLDEKHKTSVLEMGMNTPGEIRRLTEIANPTVGLVTNAAAAHLEKLHTVEAVARAKNELYETMSADGTAVYNAEDRWMKKMVQSFKGRKVSFGMGSGCDIRFEHMESAGFDSMELKIAVGKKRLAAKLKAAGIHNVMNAMAAVGAAHALGFSLEAMQRGLENFRPLQMRFEQIQLQNGVRLVNDAYNANPLSMEAAFQTAARAKRAGRFIAVLGDMKELGEQSEKLHEEAGKKAAQNGVEKLFLIGEFAGPLAEGAEKGGIKKENIAIFSTEEGLTAAVAKEMKSGDIVLIKASRAMRLERVAEELKEKFGI